jgi:hypothetical protein
MTTAAFTLLEVVMAVAITAMIVMSVYRFVSANLMAISTSTQLSEERQAMAGMIRYIEDILANLPQENPNVLTGEPFKKNNLRGDKMEWICRGGEGVLTTAAPGEYRVTLTLESLGKDSNEMALGIRRRLVDEDIKNSKFMPLLKGVAAFKLRYYDRRQNAPVDQWRFPDYKPWYVEVSIWKNVDEEPVFAILTVPGANAQPQ